MDVAMLADIEQIRQLVASYNHAWDYMDVDAYLDTWTEDGFFERSNAGRSFRGTEQLRELIATFGVNGRHMTGEHLFDIDGDSATHRCFLAYLDADDAYSVAIFGVYTDELVRTADGWRFASRRLKVDPGSGKDVGDAPGSTSP